MAQGITTAVIPAKAGIQSFVTLIFDPQLPIFTAKTLDFCGKALENSATSQDVAFCALVLRVRMMRGRTQS